MKKLILLSLVAILLVSSVVFAETPTQRLASLKLQLISLQEELSIILNQNKLLGGSIEKPQTYDTIGWKKPTTDAEWDKDLRESSVNVKYYSQLLEIKKSLQNNLIDAEKNLDIALNYPDILRYEIDQNENISLADKDKEFNQKVKLAKWEVEKIYQSMERVDKEMYLRDNHLVDRTQEIRGTTYYIDFTNGLDTNDGLATTTPFQSLDKFVEGTVLAAGDKAYVRRGMASTTNVSDLVFAYDGTFAAPNVLSADYNNLWSDFASSTQTATVNFASSTIVMSASTTGIVAGKWVFVEGDNPNKFSYEVKSISPDNVLNLYIPYQGLQSGAGLTLNVMPSNPQWNITTGDFAWMCNGDDFWNIKGIDVRGTDAVGQIDITSCDQWLLEDMIFQGDGTTAMAVGQQDARSSWKVRKSRSFDNTLGFEVDNTGYGVYVEDTYIDGNNSNARAFQSTQGIMNAKNITFVNAATTGTGGYDFQSIDTSRFNIQNFILASTTVPNFDSTLELKNNMQSYQFEDWNGVAGWNRQYGGFSISESQFVLQSTSSPLRTGGGGTSIEVYPSTDLGTAWSISKIELFNYPIYADTTSKTYSVYFRATSTTEFSANPTADELWIECDYIANSNNARAVKKSTGVIDFVGDGTTWQALSVICQPTASGVLYLKGYYAKTKEASNTNVFFADNYVDIQ